MKQLNRWVYAGIGILVMLFAGLVYAWTVLQAPIAVMFPQWTKGQLSLTFTITMVCFCLGGFGAGMMQRKVQPRILVWLSAVMYLIGFVISSMANSLIALYLGFGILAGLATGIAYNAVMSAVSCWFPDKQGFISGALLMGFGFSSFIIGKIYTAVTPSDGSAVWRTSFLILGNILFVVMALTGLFVVKPQPGWSIASGGKAKKEIVPYEEIPTGTMVKRASFWLYIVWATFLSAAGLAIISQGTPMAMEACPDITMTTVATVVGLLSIFNGIGRILFGALFDKIGRFWTMLIGGVSFILAMLLLIAALKSHSMVVLVIAYIVTGLAYGCVTPTNSAFANLYYGRKNYPTNLPVINMNMLVASFGSTLAGLFFDMTQSYMAIIIIVIAALAVGTVVSCFIKTPNKAV